MPTKTIEKKLNILTKEVNSLRSLLMSIIFDEDLEGEYKTKFIKDVEKASKKHGKYSFKDSSNFINLLKEK